MQRCTSFQYFLIPLFSDAFFSQPWSRVFSHHSPATPPPCHLYAAALALGFAFRSQGDGATSSICTACPKIRMDGLLYGCYLLFFDMMLNEFSRMWSLSDIIRCFLQLAPGGSWSILVSHIDVLHLHALEEKPPYRKQPWTRIIHRWLSIKWHGLSTTTECFCVFMCFSTNWEVGQSCHVYLKWGFPEIGLPPNHPF